MTIVVETLADLEPLVGKTLGPSSWFHMTQSRIDAFADAAGDRQWIHLDSERAKDGPFGDTIAPGYLILSLLIPMWNEILEVRQLTSKINYGLDSVRFPSPVVVDSRLRAVMALASLDEIPGGAQLSIDATIEIEGGPKPALVATPIFRFFTC